MRGLNCPNWMIFLIELITILMALHLLIHSQNLSFSHAMSFEQTTEKPAMRTTLSYLPRTIDVIRMYVNML